ncbi:MAG TPA: NnrS family protein [Rhodospirillales bacterium]|nr:NnrS family protein [Rhodospirillales bacterium]
MSVLSSMSAKRERRSRLAELPVLQIGFRPFFLGAALWLPASLAIWLVMLGHRLPWEPATGGLAWHQHAALFGGIGAIVAGFLLTAVPSWTGRPPLRGTALLLLLLTWLGGRLAGLLPGTLGAILALLLEAAFLGALAAFAWREILAAGNRRNIPVAVLLSLLALGAVLSRLDPFLGAAVGSFGRRLGLAVILMLLALIGGRITPAFTRNWLVQRGHRRLPAEWGRPDRLVLLLWGATLLLWLVASEAAAVPFLLSGVAHLVRLSRWRGGDTLAEPLVAVLHLGYAWLGIGGLLYGAALLGVGPPPSTAFHAFTTGAFGTMTLAVMTRATLGHTGRPLAADRVTTAIYLLVVAGAVLRLLTPLWPGDPASVLVLSALAWGGAYILFAARFGPMLLRPRLTPINSGGSGRR